MYIEQQLKYDLSTVLMLAQSTERVRMDLSNSVQGTTKIYESGVQCCDR